MVVVSVLYPNSPGARFDMGYYREVHLPLVRHLLGPCGMRSLSYLVPIGAEPAFRLIAELRFDTQAAADEALRLHGPATQADIPKFTDIPPLIAIGDLQQG